MTRPLLDRLELSHPIVATTLSRIVMGAPAPVRRRFLDDAFARAEASFNRGDIDAILATFSPDVEYDPPPPLPGARHITGRQQVADYWRGVFAAFAENRIENREVLETSRGTIRRVARLTHTGGTSGAALAYEILQTTTIRGGRVVAQTNELAMT